MNVFISYAIELALFLVLLGFIAVLIRENKRLRASSTNQNKWNVDPSTSDQMTRVLKKLAVVAHGASLMVEYNKGVFEVMNTKLDDMKISKGATLGIALAEFETRLDVHYNQIKATVQAI